MYQLRSQINLFDPYTYQTGVFICTQSYLKGKKRVPGALFGDLRQIGDHKKSLKNNFHLFWTFYINIMIGFDLNFGLLGLYNNFSLSFVD